MKVTKIIFSIAFLVLIFGGCTYSFIVEEEVIDPNNPDTEEVSFSDAIVPIFGTKCTSCHSTGNQLPDLTPDNAYSSVNSSRYINKGTPGESLIYTRALPANTDSHPKYSEAEAAKVLTWITQGAKNN